MNRKDAWERLYGIDFDCSLVEVVSLLVNVWGERRGWLCLLAALKGFTVPIPSDIERLIPGRGSTHCLNPHSLLNVIAEIKWRNARWNYTVEVGGERERSGWFLKQHIISHLYSYSVPRISTQSPCLIQSNRFPRFTARTTTDSWVFSNMDTSSRDIENRNNFVCADEKLSTHFLNYVLGVHQNNFRDQESIEF